MGVNVGAFVSPLTVAWLRAHYGWSVAFMSAAGAMLVSLAIFIGFNRTSPPLPSRSTMRRVRVMTSVPGEARSRIITLLAIFGISLVFWIAFYQIFYTFTFWARDSTATTWSPRFQTFEPLGVILLSPVLVAIWASLQRRHRTLDAGEDAAWRHARRGGVRHARVCRVYRRQHRPRVAAWLICANLLIAVGEISLSPMGMSLVNRLSPPRLRGLMMGGWFASLGIGGYLSGSIGAYWDRMPHSSFFLMVVAILVVVAVPLSLLTPQIKRTIRRAEQSAVAAEDHGSRGISQEA
jgi:POT family proton-dependent oligopeptide transporter